jgi:hypothetical protein
MEREIWEALKALASDKLKEVYLKHGVTYNEIEF